MVTSLDCCNQFAQFLSGWTHRLRSRFRHGALFGSALVSVACGAPASPSNTTVATTSSQVASTGAGAGVAVADLAATEQTQQARAPVRKPPPPGTVAIPGMAAVAELCEGQQTCPLLKLAAAQAHCRKKANANEAWRLPTKDEAQALATISQPAQAQVFHWTSTPFVQDPKQAWIVMPAQLQYTTTYSGDHKNFVARCVRDVADSSAP